jgi:Right handed beta helix region
MNSHRCTLIIAIGMLVGLPGHAPAGDPAHPSIDLYVSVLGTKNDPCSPQRPCSLQGAQTRVRSVKSQGSSSIVVHIAAGTYPLHQPLIFTSLDSGVEGHSITWKANSQVRPVLSGAMLVSGWQQVPGKPWLWRATVPPGHDRIHNLWFRGFRAVPVRAPGCDEHGCKYVPAGVTNPNPAMAQWEYPQDIMAVGFDDWRDYHCGVERIDAKEITLDQGCWANANAVSDRNDYLGWHVTTPKDGRYWRGFNWFENVYDALSPKTVGQFFHDPISGTVYYVPRPREHPLVAMAATNDALLIVSGAKNLRFEGLEFSYAGWQKVEAENGYIGTQAGFSNDHSRTEYIGTYAGFSNDNGHAGAPFRSDGSDWTKMAAAVQVRHAENIAFDNDVFTHLGAAGLTLADSSSNNVVDGCSFNDISGNGMQIGDVDQATITHHRPLENGDRITNNVIDHIAQEFRDSVGIWAGYVSAVVIDHNTLRDLPYSGISIGWGWGLDLENGPTGAGENRITNNRILHTMVVLKDGGAIYTQGSQPHSVITGNYVDDINGYGKGIYLDEESMHFDVYSNVITNATGFWLSMWSHRNGDLKVHDNYTDSTRLSNGNPKNIVVSNHTGLRHLPEAAIEMAAQAGAPGTRGAPPPFPVDCALMKPSTQSTTLEPSSLYGAFRGNDGDDDGHETLSHPAETTGAGSDPNPWWEVDLGHQTYISTVQVFNREVYESALSDFTLYVSDKPIPTGTPKGNLNLSHADVYHGVPNVRTDVSIDRPGRYIRLQLRGVRKLVLVELKAFPKVGQHSVNFCNSVPKEPQR